MQSRFRWALIAVLCTLLMVACGGISPAPVDSYQINVTPVPDAPNEQEISSLQISSGVYNVTIAPGSIPDNASVEINNLRTGEYIVAVRNPDGSYAASISAQVGDKLAISYIVDGIQSSITYVYVGAFNIKNPYKMGGYWYVGQVHFHTTHSDGKNTPAQMEAAYYDAGYDFVVSTDHRGTLPMFIDPDSGLTPDPDNSSSGKDLLWIRGTELGFGGVHMGAWGQEAQTPIFAYDDAPADIQLRIDNVRANHGLVAINHPNNEDPPYAWDWYGEIKKTRRYSFVEAFNGKHAVSVDGSVEINHLPTAVDLADEFYQVWWIGVDDCHDKDDPTQFDRYAIVVQTDSAAINQRDLLSSADSGDLYIREGAHGPQIASVTVEGNTITLVMADAGSTYDVTWKKRGNEIVQTDLGVVTSASYTVKGNEGYVRAEVTRKSDGKHAYTQPLFIANNVDLARAVSVSSGIDAGNLIDNNSSTYWDAQANTASFVVDVGSVRLVNAIKIDWYGEDARRFNYKIETSDTGAFAGEQKEVERETYGNRSISTLDFFDEATRYIKVTVTNQSVGAGDTVRINEVQVFDSSPARTQLYLDDVNGDDSNDGLAGRPWRTFNYARDKVRPRDTLNFVSTGVPYPGQMELFATESGKNRYATIIFQGNPATLTEVDATGMYSGININGSCYVDWKYFDVHSALTANVLTNEFTSNVSFMYNRIHDSADKGFLGAGNFLFAYNLVYANAKAGALIYRDGTDANIYNNVFYGNGTYGVQFDKYYQTTPVVARVMNNIVAANAYAALERGEPGTITDEHNCVEGGYVGSWQQTGSLNVDPLFMSPQTGDFRLQAASPCIDAGIDVGLSMDFSGSPPRDAPLIPNTGDPGNFGKDYIDIGAYEY